MTGRKLIFRIRAMILFFVITLILSGVTAFPVHTEMKWITENNLFSDSSLIGSWLLKVWHGVAYVNDNYTFLFYGYDWLAFAHIMIGLAFIGPYRDPVKNKWVINWAILCCICIVPLAVVAGPIRGIPWYHILIDCAFGVLGLIPLFITRSWIRRLEEQQDN